MRDFEVSKDSGQPSNWARAQASHLCATDSSVIVHHRARHRAIRGRMGERVWYQQLVQPPYCQLQIVLQRVRFLYRTLIQIGWISMILFQFIQRFRVRMNNLSRMRLFHRDFRRKIEKLLLTPFLKAGHFRRKFVNLGRTPFLKTGNF